MEFDAFEHKKIYLCSYSILSLYNIKLIRGYSPFCICSNKIKYSICKLNRQSEETVMFKFFFIYFIVIYYKIV